jgi:hypothetical protein
MIYPEGTINQTNKTSHHNVQEQEQEQLRLQQQELQQLQQ